MSNAIRDWKLPSWFLGVFAGLVVEVFLLIAFGGSVRLMKAGLACPDWPLCFGDVIPDYHPQVYFEFIHRVLAGVVAIVTLTLQIVLFRSSAPKWLKWLGFASLGLLLGQILFGALTVWLLLKAGVVSTHLLLGTSFFISLLWIYLTLKTPEAEPVTAPRGLRSFLVLVTAALFAQILLGGLVASNQVALVCIDWPKCHGQWFPTFAGGIGLHMIHRLGGYTGFLLVLTNFFVIRKFAPTAQLKRLSTLLLIGVCGQVCLGVANIVLLTPPLIAVCHLALGVGLLSVAFRQLHATRKLVGSVATSKSRVRNLAPARA